MVDETGREVPERHQGRLQFTGPSATVGYPDNAQATRGLFDGDWPKTGDLAYVAGGKVYGTELGEDRAGGSDPAAWHAGPIRSDGAAIRRYFGTCSRSVPKMYACNRRAGPLHFETSILG